LICSIFNYPVNPVDPVRKKATRIRADLCPDIFFSRRGAEALSSRFRLRLNAWRQVEVEKPKLKAKGSWRKVNSAIKLGSLEAERYRVKGIRRKAEDSNFKHPLSRAEWRAGARMQHNTASRFLLPL